MPNNWLNKILDHEVTPPEKTWANITNELDKEENKKNTTGLKEKMLAHEETPPAGVLENILTKLNKEERQPEFVGRIKNYAEEVPSSAWGNITNKLDQQEARVIPLQHERKKLRAVYFRIGAAAAIIAIILMFALPMINKHPKTDNRSITSAKSQLIPTAPKKGIEKTVAAPVDTKNGAIAVNRVKKSSDQKTDNYVSDYIKGNEAVELAQNPADNSKEKLLDTKGETPTDISLMNTPNTYISVTGADGQTVKWSSKFSNIIGTLNNNNPNTKENIEVIIEENAKWRAMFTAWSHKMINNSIAPSFSNFMDIIELSKILEEKN